jgi:hypothetical protein
MDKSVRTDVPFEKVGFVCQAFADDKAEKIECIKHDDDKYTIVAWFRQGS